MKNEFFGWPWKKDVYWCAEVNITAGILKNLEVVESQQ
jgi:hypothetical protein